MIPLLRLFWTSFGMLQQPRVSPPKDNDVAVDDDLLRRWGQAILLLIFSVLLGYAIRYLAEKARRRTSKRPVPINTSPPFSSDETSSLHIPLDHSSSTSSGLIWHSLTSVLPLFSHPSLPPVPLLSPFPFSSPPAPRRVPGHDWVKKLKRLHIDVIPYEELKPCFEEILGSGAYGTVVALSGKFSGYCLKIFTQVFLGHQAFVEEVTLMHRLAHLKIPRLKGICLDPKGIIMSRHQSTLLRWMIRKPQPMDALAALIQLCHIVNDLHSEGLCHNDLKCSNVMIDHTKNGMEVILIDFGLTARFGHRPFYIGRSLTVGEQADLLMSQGYKSFYAPRLYIGGRCSPSTDAYALAYIAKKVFKYLNFKGHSRLRRVLNKYLKSFGDTCSVNDILYEMQSVWDEAQKKKPTH